MLDRTQKSRWPAIFFSVPVPGSRWVPVKRGANATASTGRIGQVPRTKPVDDFSLAYERSGAGAPVLLLHGGHFSPLEAPEAFVTAIRDARDRSA